MFNREKIILVFLLIVFSCFNASAQDDELPSGAIKMICGSLLVWNEEGNN